MPVVVGHHPDARVVAQADCAVVMILRFSRDTDVEVHGGRSQVRPFDLAYGDVIEKPGLPKIGPEAADQSRRVVVAFFETRDVLEDAGFEVMLAVGHVAHHVTRAGIEFQSQLGAVFFQVDLEDVHTERCTQVAPIVRDVHGPLLVFLPGRLDECCTLRQWPASQP